MLIVGFLNVFFFSFSCQMRGLFSGYITIYKREKKCTIENYDDQPDNIFINIFNARNKQHNWKKNTQAGEINLSAYNHKGMNPYTIIFISTSMTNITVYIVDFIVVYC